MRILLVHQKLGYSGTASYAFDLALALRRQGDDVRLATMGGDQRRVFIEQGFATYLVKLNWFSFPKLLQFLREFDPDIIHVMSSGSAWLGQRLSHRLNLPHIVTVHRSPPPEGHTLPLIHPHLAGVIAGNEVIRAALVNQLRIPKALVRVIQKGVDTDVLAPEPAGAGWSVERPAGVQGEAAAGGDAAAAEAGAPRPAAPPGVPGRPIPVIGYVGGLVRAKGPHVLIQALRQVLDHGVDAFCAIVGEGEDEAHLRRLVRELRLESHVTFSPNMPDRRDVYRIFDIVVVPTLKAGVGASALEAMSLGKPLVATAVGEILHVIADGQTGLLVPKDDPAGLAQRLLELLRDPDAARAMGARARAVAIERFSIVRMVKETREFYEETLARLSEAETNPVLGGGSA